MDGTVVESAAFAAGIVRLFGYGSLVYALVYGRASSEWSVMRETEFDRVSRTLGLKVEAGV